MKVWGAKLLAYVLSKDRVEGLPGVSGVSMLVLSSGGRISLAPFPSLISFIFIQTIAVSLFYLEVMQPATWERR